MPKKKKKQKVTPIEFVDMHHIIQDTLKKQMHQEIENVGILLGRKIADIKSKDIVKIH